jgi:hypothetical protein
MEHKIRLRKRTRTHWLDKDRRQGVRHFVYNRTLPRFELLFCDISPTRDDLSMIGKWNI